MPPLKQIYRTDGALRRLVALTCFLLVFAGLYSWRWSGVEVVRKWSEADDDPDAHLAEGGGVNGQMGAIDLTTGEESEEQAATKSRSHDENPETTTTTENNNNNNFTTTIVTGYFDLTKYRDVVKNPDGKKHSHSTYLEWAALTLETPSPIIIYTDQPHLFAPLRGTVDKSLTRIVALNFTSLPYVRDHLARIQAIFPRDIKRWGKANLPAFYALWYSKIQLMKMAIAEDPFHTPKFLWMDVGSRRATAKDETRPDVGPRQVWYPPPQEVWRSTLFPNPKMEKYFGGSDGKRVTMFAIPRSPFPCGVHPNKGMYVVHASNPNGNPLTHTEKPFYREVSDVKPISVFLVGGFFGGTKEALLKLEAIHARELKKYLYSERAEYRLDDQFFMAAIACTHNKLVEVILPSFQRESVVANWYYSLKFFAGYEPAIHLE